MNQSNNGYTMFKCTLIEESFSPKCTQRYALSFGLKIYNYFIASSMNLTSLTEFNKLYQPQIATYQGSFGVPRIGAASDKDCIMDIAGTVKRHVGMKMITINI